MTRIYNRAFARIAVSVSAAALVALGTAFPSFADSSIDIKAGSLGTSSSAGTGVGTPIYFTDFAPVTLNGRAQTPTIRFNFADIIDSTGSGLGWHLSLTMSHFTTAGTPSRTLSNGSLTVKNTAFVSALDQSSTPVIGDSGGPPFTNGITSPNLTPGIALDTTAAITLVTAGAKGGMGSYSLSPVDLVLDLPATVYSSGVGTPYISTITMSLISAP